MARPSSSLIQYLRSIAGAYREDARSDSELLARYAETHDETAFSTLAVRHGPLVWNVCRRILGDTADAEDVVQATFLALARRADKIHIQTAAGWLHQVAQRVSLNIRSAARARRRLQEKLQAKSSLNPAHEVKTDDLHEALHEELAKMPEKLRVPLVLHYLEGKTQVEIGGILGASERGVRRRLTKGKAVLQKRLTQRGLALGAATLGTLLAETASPAAMPPGLVHKTVQAALDFRSGALTGGIADLTKQVLKHAPAAIPWWKSSWMLTFLCVSGLAAGVVGVVWKADVVVTKAGDEKIAIAQQEPRGLERQKAKSGRLDIYGDPLPEGAVARIGTLRFRPSYPHDPNFSWEPGDVAFSPDGKAVFSSHLRTNVIHVWETATGKEVRCIQGPRGENSESDALILAASSRRKQLAALHRKSGNLWIWDLQDDSPRPRWKGKTPMSPDDHSFLVFSPDGATLAYSGWIRLPDPDDKQKQIMEQFICLLDVATGKELRRLNITNLDGCQKLIFSPDGKLIASWSVGRRHDDRKSVCLWDVATGRKLHTLSCPAPVASFAFSLDGATLAIAGNDQVLRLWDAATGVKYQQWRLGKYSPPDAFIAYLPDGKTLLATENEQVRFLDPTTGKECRPAVQCPGLFAQVTGGSQLFRSEPSRRNLLSPDGRWLASATGISVGVWDLTTGKEASPIGMANYRMTSIDFSPDGRTLATDTMPGVVQVWDAETGKLRRRLNGESLEHGSDAGWDGLRYTKDGRVYTLQTQGHQVGEHAVLIGWDARKHIPIKPVRDISIGAGWTVSRDGRLAAIAYADRIVLFDAATGKELRKIQGADGDASKMIMTGLNFLAVSDYGDALISMSTTHDARLGYRFSIAVWDVASGRSRLGNRPIVLNGSPNDDLYHAGALGVLTAAGGSYHPPVILSPDSRWLAVAIGDIKASFGDDERPNDRIQLWEVATGLIGPRLPTFTPAAPGSICPLDVVQCLAFSPNGRLVAAGSQQVMVEGGHNPGPGMPAVQVWDVATGRKLRRFTGHLDTVTALAFSLDGGRLASASYDTTALVWDVRNLGGQTQGSEDRSNAEDLWKALMGTNEIQASRAAFWLSDAPEQALPLLRERLKVLLPDFKQVDRWLAELNDERTEVYKQALAALKKCGLAVESKLQHALAQAEKARKHFYQDAEPVPPVIKQRVIELRGCCQQNPSDHAAMKLLQCLKRLEKGLDATPAASQIVLLGNYCQENPSDHAVEKLLQSLKQLLERLCRNEAALRGLIKQAIALPEWKGRMRGVKVLERIGTPDAQRLLQEWADSRDDGPAAQARTALRRLAKKKSAFKSPLWTALASLDAADAYCAICCLSEAPEKALPLLREETERINAIDPKQAERWLVDLDDKRFQIRKQAMSALEKGGPAIEGVLQKALKRRMLTSELRRQLQELTGRLSTMPQWLAVVRGVEVLERIGTPEAQKLLENLAKLEEGALAMEAHGALQRLAKRSQIPAP